MSAQRAAVFFDRDGTLLDELGYLADPEAVRLYPGAAAAVRAVNQAGWSAVLVTNQSGIARGLLDEPLLAAVHDRLRALLAEEGAELDLVLHCPHHPSEGVPPYRADCTCRKPAPGMLLEAARELDLDLTRSWMVGDANRDLEAGRRAGLAGVILVQTGKGRTEAEAARAAGAPVLPDALAAVRHVLALQGK